MRDQKGFVMAPTQRRHSSPIQFLKYYLGQNCFCNLASEKLLDVLGSGLQISLDEMNIK